LARRGFTPESVVIITASEYAKFNEALYLLIQMVSASHIASGVRSRRARDPFCDLILATPAMARRVARQCNADAKLLRNLRRPLPREVVADVGVAAGGIVP
jgi:hypothetical protein